jgi:hypothetical protein
MAAKQKWELLFGESLGGNESFCPSMHPAHSKKLFGVGKSISMVVSGWRVDFGKEINGHFHTKMAPNDQREILQAALGSALNNRWAHLERVSDKEIDRRRPFSNDVTLYHFSFSTLEYEF